MPNELQQKIEELTQKISLLEEQLKTHNHNGFIGNQIDIRETFGLLRTITVAGELTNVTAQPAKIFHEQMFIDTTTATKKLYVFDAVGNTWYSVTIT
jgi:uncharacterized protein with ATP-grasp and redox domains